MSKNKQYVFEQLGAPINLFRNESAYTPMHDEPLNMDAPTFLDYQRKLKRSQARWYYMMDYKSIRPVMQKLPRGFLGPAYKAYDDAGEDDDDDDDDDDEFEAPSKHRMSKYHCLSLDQESANDDDMTNDANDGDDSPNIDWTFLYSSSLPLQQEIRAQMLLSANEAVPKSAKAIRKRLKLMRLYQQYDALYLPRRMRAPAGANLNKSPTSRRLSKRAAQLTRRMDRNRLDRADPSYLAPFDATVINEMARDDLVEQYPVACVNSGAEFVSKAARRQDLYYNNMDSCEAPVHYGNCLATTTCPCDYCRASANPSWCLLHATGPLLDRITCSFLQFPEDALPDQQASATGAAAVLDIGDSLRQLEECGTDMFVARTMLHLTVFRLVAPTCTLASCAQTVQFQTLHRIDLRSANRARSSYLPIDITCHPKYGRGWTDASIVGVYNDTNRREQKTLKHFQAGDAYLRETSHYISNLETIFRVEYSSHHPMVLWSVARSHVSSMLAESETSTQHPRSGRGFSLYSIDLRSDQGTFQWSPSAEEFRVEGTHSLTGVFTDWHKDHAVFASSISAGKTWEIDTRMPCRSICSWSLPSRCDDSDTVLSPMSLNGYGSLFAQPKRASNDQGLLSSLPVLNVSTAPLAFGIHCYQRPIHGPRYHAKSLESPASPALAFLSDASIAASSSFALPDVSDRVFTCGLCAIELPTPRILTPNKLAQIGCHQSDIEGAACVISTTSKGDVYSHILLASTASHSKSKIYDDLPLGTNAVPLPDDSSDFLTSLSREMFSGPGRICVSLTRQYPIPSSAILSVRTKNPDRETGSPLKQAADAMDERMEDEVRVPPSLVNDAVVTEQNMSGNNVHLPQELADQCADEFEEAFSSFDHRTIRGAKMNNGEEIRTDLTTHLLTKSAGAWPDLMNDN
ncbi:hypothetical protein MPSEU_000192100 [Mayamaea pseudoterrestris]|nr:hypothetical protein MPSEU_000192100 [Mayamaea pseudoterrestris]